MAYFYELQENHVQFCTPTRFAKCQKKEKKKRKVQRPIFVYTSDLATFNYGPYPTFSLFCYITVLFICVAPISIIIKIKSPPKSATPVSKLSCCDMLAGIWTDFIFYKIAQAAEITQKSLFPTDLFSVLRTNTGNLEWCFVFFFKTMFINPNNIIICNSGNNGNRGRWSCG